MHLDEVLIDSTERFLDEILNEEENDQLTEAANRICEILTDEAECFTHLSDVEVLESIQSELDEVWNQISMEEKCKNPILKNSYEELVMDLDQYMTMIERRLRPRESKDF